MPLFDDLERRRAEIERHRENSARMGYATAKFQTTGQGSFEFDERISFGLTFTEEPSANFGFETDLDDLEDALGRNDNDVPPLPIVTGYITTWDQDDRGFWTGAWYAARVWFPPTDLIPVTAKVQVQHHLTFRGVAMKDVPLDEGVDD